MENKNCLLTGAGGFLGKIVAEALSKLDYNIIGLDRFGQKLNIDIVNKFVLDKTQIYDLVIHAAGKAHSIPHTEDEKMEFFQINFEGTKNLCEALLALTDKPKAFIFISTVAVYGRDSGDLILETHPLNGITPYAKSKILAEKWLENWAKLHDITLGIIRLPLIAGPNAPGNLGAMISGIRSGRYLSIGKADASKSMVWQDDIPLVMPSLARIGGIYNLTDGMHPTFKELETIISRKLNKKKPITIPVFLARILAKIGDVLGDKAPIDSLKLSKITSSLTFDDNSARNKLGWNPSSVLQKMEENL